MTRRLTIGPPPSRGGCRSGPQDCIVTGERRRQEVEHGHEGHHPGRNDRPGRHDERRRRRELDPSQRAPRHAFGRIVKCLLADPERPETVYAGTDLGLYRTDDAGAKWQRLDTPMNGSMVWSLAIDPVDPRVMFAGTGTPSTPGIYRSTDAGKTWERLAVEIAAECPNVGTPRPTGIAVDPIDHRRVWVGLEVDGVRHSAEGGDTWTRVNGQIPNPDVHCVLAVAGPPRTVFTVVNDEVWRSTDDGKSWQAARAREVFPWHYPR